MDVLSAIVTLVLVMDPLGNVPLFLSALRTVRPERRRHVLVREILFAYLVLVVFLLLGRWLLTFLGLRPEAVGIAGGIVLFLIAIRMIFPEKGPVSGDTPDGEPFLVPLAIPLVAGPSTLATLLLLESAKSTTTIGLMVAVTVAWGLTAVILLSSTSLYRLLGERVLIAMERLMGMLLVMVAVQMLIDGARISLAVR
jgi:multiple antibiotic resistance protein